MSKESKIEPLNLKSKSTSIEILESKYMTELKEIVSNKFKVPTTIQGFHKILDKNGLETLEEWKKLTKEQKKNPDGLKHLLDEVCGIENKVEWNYSKIFLNFILFIRSNESQLEQLR
jgi:mevalonate kinase